MQDMEKFLKECNLVFTGTNNRLDFCTIGFDYNDVEVNYDNTTSLYGLVDSFNKLYVSFKKEYDELEKIDFGKRMELIDFSKLKYDGDDYRILEFYVSEPKGIKRPNTFLFLREINGKNKSFVSNRLNYYDKGYYSYDVEIDDNIVKKYLDLFEKYRLLLETYEYLKNKQIFGDGTFSMYTVIDEYKSDLLKGLNNFRIAFGSSYFDTEYFIYLNIKLGDNFGIDYHNCEYIYDGDDIALDNSVYDNLFNNIYINKKYTRDRRRYK